MAMRYIVLGKTFEDADEAVNFYLDSPSEDRKKVQDAYLMQESGTSDIESFRWIADNISTAGAWLTLIRSALYRMGYNAVGQDKAQGTDILGAVLESDDMEKMDRRTLRELMDIGRVNACEDGMFEVMLDLGLSLMVHTDGCADANAEDLRDEVAAHATEAEDDSGIVYRVVDGLPRRKYKQYFRYCAYAEFEAESDDAARFIGPLMSPTSRFGYECNGPLDRLDDNGRYEETIEEGE